MNDAMSKDVFSRRKFLESSSAAIAAAGMLASDAAAQGEKQPYPSNDERKPYPTKDDRSSVPAATWSCHPASINNHDFSGGLILHESSSFERCRRQFPKSFERAPFERGQNYSIVIVTL